MPATGRSRRPAVAAAVGLLVLAAVGCRSVAPDATTLGTGVVGHYAGLRGSAVGSGSTFQAPYQEVAIDAFGPLAPDVDVNFHPSGSGRGKQELADQLVDFAATDSVVRAEDRPKFKGGDLVTVPVVAAPVAVVYNLAGIELLQLRPETLAGIFQREVTRWDDPRIVADNPGSALPGRPIILARRADNSGTTNNFTSYLRTAAGSDWHLGSGDSIAWPDDTQAGVGNAGVSQVVQASPGAIGYVDFADAEALHLLTVAIRNRSGAFVRPTVDGAAQALSTAAVSDDLVVDALDASSPAAYPITAVTYLVTYRRQDDREKADALRGYLSFLLSDGQQLAPTADMAPLPEALRVRAAARLDAIGTG
jgi:phosphate transport system substrate-binding protein